jgi:hypothetical protein
MHTRCQWPKLARRLHIEASAIALAPSLGEQLMPRHFTLPVVLSVFVACGGSDRHSETPSARHLSSATAEVTAAPTPPIPATVPSAPVSKNPALRPSLRSPELAELRSNRMHAPLQAAGSVDSER